MGKTRAKCFREIISCGPQKILEKLKTKRYCWAKKLLEKPTLSKKLECGEKIRNHHSKEKLLREDSTESGWEIGKKLR